MAASAIGCSKTPVYDSEIVVEVDFKSALILQAKNQKYEIYDALRDEDIRYKDLSNDNGVLTLTVHDINNYEKALSALRILEKDFGEGAKQFPAITLTGNGTDSITVSKTQGYVRYLKDKTLLKTIDILQRRIDPAFSGKAIVSLADEDRILIRIGEGFDATKFKNRISRSARLSLNLVHEANDRTMDLAFERGVFPDGTILLPYPETDSYLLVEERTSITGECIKSAKEGTHPERENFPILNFSFNSKCAAEFGKLTEDNIGKRFAVVLNGEVITAPNIRLPIYGGSGFIEGGFSDLEEAAELALMMNSGALPARLNIVEERW